MSAEQPKGGNLVLEKTKNKVVELIYDAWGMPESPNKLLNNGHGNYVFATFTGHIYDTTLDIYSREQRAK